MKLGVELDQMVSKVSSGLSSQNSSDSPGSFTFIGTNSGGATGAAEERANKAA